MYNTRNSPPSLSINVLLIRAGVGDGRVLNVSRSDGQISQLKKQLSVTQAFNLKKTDFKI